MFMHYQTLYNPLGIPIIKHILRHQNGYNLPYNERLCTGCISYTTPLLVLNPRAYFEQDNFSVFFWANPAKFRNPKIPRAQPCRGRDLGE